MKRWLRFGISLLITVVGFWWTFKDTNWDKMLTSLKTAHYSYLVPYFGLLTVIHLCRALRWGNLMSGLEKVPFSKLNEASAIGFMMLLVLPFRLGEFARPFLIAERTNIRRSPAMTSVVLERIVDGIIIAVMLRALLFFVPGESDTLNRIKIGGNIMFAVFTSGLAFLIIARLQHERVIKLVRFFGDRISKGLTDTFVRVVDGFVSALRQLPDARNIALFTFYTAMYWLCNGVSMALLAAAFDCSGVSNGASCEPLNISLFAAFLTLGVLVGGLMIPAAPGSAGTFQASILLGLSVFVAPEVVNSSGVAFANVLWATQLAQQIGFGLVFLVLSKGSFAGIAGQLSAQQSGPAESK